MFSKNLDIYFDWTSLTILGIFSIELIISSIVVDGYFLSFFFFLDLVSTASLIFDVNFITNMIFSTGASVSVAALASQSKASRAATRAVRIVKLFRIIRIIKLYKNSEKAKEIKEKAKQQQLLKEKLQKRKNRMRGTDSMVKDHFSSHVQPVTTNIVIDAKKTDK